ncbi:MAG: DNA mismatch repair protein MutS [Proteobacteria bacterium]|nr:DNA mismatch repair protein MutS [Pseudomonadota bacterium]
MRQPWRSAPSCTGRPHAMTASRNPRTARAPKAQTTTPQPSAEERALFRQAVAGARPIAPSGRVTLAPPAPSPIPLQRLRDEQAALAESLSDEVDVDSLLETDELLSFRRPGIGPDIVRKLRRGHWVMQAELDLHGMRRDEARESLSGFIHCVRAQGMRCVRIIHGKGLSSPGREPVLKHKVRAWLVQKDEVLAFCQAKPSDGGAGALVVLLRGVDARRARRA